jgi:hypothetical protein
VYNYIPYRYKGNTRNYPHCPPLPHFEAYKAGFMGEKAQNVRVVVRVMRVYKAAKHRETGLC